ncbi:MAG: Spy/CpxP family protein refolding chaperone [bacterium]
MNKKSFITSLLVAFTLMAILVSFTSPSANAFWGSKGQCMTGPGPGQGMGPGGGGPGKGRHLGQLLDLSTQQQQKMHDLQFAFQKKTLNLRDELGKKRLEQKTLLENSTVDWKKVDELTDQISKLRASMEKERMRHRVEVKKILTPEQLKKFESMPYWHGGPDGDDLPPAQGSGCGLGKGPGTGPGRAL